MSSITRVPGGYRARWRTPDGASRSKTFPLKGDAQRHLTQVEGAKLVGAYVDPRAGRVTFGEFALVWQAAQVHRPSTAILVDSHVANHMLPAFGARPLAAIRPSEVQTWVRGLGNDLAPGTVKVVVQHARAIFRAAVRDRLISSSPCDGLKLPTAERTPIIPLEREAILALIEALPDRYRAIAVVCAGAGLRPAEALGLTLDEVDLLRRQVTLRHQLVTLPKVGTDLASLKTPQSARTVPLPDFVTFALARHLEHAGGAEVIAARPYGLLFLDEGGAPIARNRFGDLWRAAVAAAKLPRGVRCHDMRHFYASALIRHGESVKTVQARLGHKSAVVTLDTYGHLWPDSEDRTRRALDEVFGPSVSNTGSIGEQRS